MDERKKHEMYRQHMIEQCLAGLSETVTLYYRQLLEHGCPDHLAVQLVCCYQDMCLTRSGSSQ